ncbi:bifunctional phosphopantothenoylcysteine decarboxylase/phosphopantothenate--cysteine ligase CoaBC [Fundidesulfovibrio soli]|uniref:bifunctional phosphopantothenoylcysteine decarboxylase/phosphopantothenate--cysteine ligase CoaBC n=1 Tax=Fundidesulfovibrio soli TaxID=2922716 RepID=UPI001FB00CA6|nr:bifunctional phosphopantothenoylcysteine decarboxylase/phosphopantothenate--cysteine ligase CoaBC [Fundidesulfovibrio soli]
MLPHHLKFTVHHGERVHLGVTGSIAAYKSLELLRILGELELIVSVTLTEAATRFITPLSFESLGASHVYSGMWNGSDSAFGHLEPSQEARCMVIAPATANTIAKLAHGLADELLSTQALAFAGPMLVAPAMNPRLWDAKPTQHNLAMLRDRGVTVIEPECGQMACGETGKGRMPNPHDIAAQVLKAMTNPDMAGSRVLVSLGPTREFFDPARYWSNPSTGLMGAALAMAAWLRGADVTVVHGPVDIWLPGSIRRIAVRTAQEMFDACTGIWSRQDYGIMTAAVSDFSPVPYGNEKFKKRSMESDEIMIPFRTNPDILRTLGANKAEGQRLMGFCAETSDLARYASMKLKEKNCDMMVANSIAVTGPDASSGFAAKTNQVLVVDSVGRSEQWPTLTKTEVAWRLLEWMTQLLP